MKFKLALLSAPVLVLLSAVIIAAAPNAPTNISASNGHYADRIEVSWDEVPNAQLYRVYRSREDNPNLRVILGPWQAEPRYVDRTAENGRRYHYWVKVSDGKQIGDFSTAGSGYLKVDKLMGAVVAVRDTDNANGVRLVWDGVLGAKHYRVYRGTRADTVAAVPVSDWITAAEFRDLKAVPGFNFHYWVKSAFDSRGSGASAFAAAVRGQRVLASPTNLSIDSDRPEAVVVKWNGAVGARFYRLYRSAQPYAVTAEPVSAWMGAAEFADRTAVPGKSYYYWVKAAANASNSGASAFSSPISGYRLLSQPVAVESLPIENGIKLRWHEVEGAAAYRVYRGTSPYAQASTPIGEWFAGASLVDDTAEPGVRYNYWVKAARSRTGQRESAFSSVAAGLLPLSAPAALEATLSAGRVLLQWEEVAGATHYRVYRGIDPDVAAAVAIGSWQEAVGFVDGETLPGVHYYYWIKAAKGMRGQLAGAMGVRASSFRAMVAPGWLSTSQGSFADRVEVSWESVTGASYYRVYRSTSPNPTFHVPLGGWQRPTQYMDSGVDPGVRYYYWVKAAPMADGEGASLFSAISSGFLGDTVLPAPAQISATDGDFADRVEIVWPKVTGGSHYRIYRSDRADPTTAQPLTSWQTVTAWVDQQVVPGEIYYYWVQVATGSAGENASGFGSLNSGYRELVPPSAVQVTTGRLGEIEVAWEPTEGAGFFRIYRGNSARPSAARALSEWQTSTRFIDRTATPGATHYYWVKASPKGNGANASGFGQGTSGYRALGAPSGLALTGEPAVLRLHWQAVAGASYYQVLRAEGFDVQRAESLGKWQRETEFDDRTAVPGVSYNYWVQAAVNREGERASAASVMRGDYRRIAAAVLEEVSQGDRDRVALGWDPVAGASHYQIWRSDGPFPGMAQVVGEWQAASEFADKNAELGVTYYYWVKAAVNAEGFRAGGLSAAADGFRGLAEITPQVLTNNAAQIDLSWQAVDGARAYRVYRSELPDARQAGPLMNWRPNTVFSDDTALPGVTYYYWVRSAADDEGLNATPLGTAVSGHRVLHGAGGLTATRGELAAVDLAWAEVPGATHYRIYRGIAEDAARAESIGSWASARSFSDETALPGVTYYYWVRSATSALGHKAGSFGQAVQGYRSVVAPGGIIGSNGDPQSISIAWQPVAGATHYQVYRTHDVDNVLAEPISAWQENVVFVDLQTQPGVTYTYWVRAAANTSGANASRFSEKVTANRGLFAPPAPQVISGGLDGVSLEWEPVAGANYYRLYRSVDGNPQGAELLADWQAARAYADVGADPGVVYNYRVQAAAAADGNNASAFGSIGEGFRGLEAPLQPGATTGEAGRVRLNWSAVPGAQYYRVLRATTDDPAGATPGGWLSESAYDDMDVALGETYYYWVQAAADSSGSIASALSAAIRGYEALPAPNNLQIRAEGSSIVLNWEPNSQFDMLRYRIYAGVDSASVSLIDSVSANELSLVNIASVLPLPSRFNLGDLGLGVFDSRPSISARFTELIGRAPTAAELDELFTGRKLERATVAPLDPGNSYYFEIIPVNEQGREGGRVGGSVGLVNTVSLVVVGGDQRIDVNWTPVWGVSAYRLYRHTSDAVQEAAPVGDWQVDTVFTDNSAKRGQDYYYWLRTAPSLTELNPGPFSAVASGSRPVAAPPLVAASVDLADRVNLEWLAGEGAEAFRVFHHRNNDWSAAIPVSGWLSESNFEHLGALPGANYYWLQAASDTGGEHISTLSTVSTGQRTGSLVAPTDLEASWGVYKDRVVVTWKREPAVSHVQVYCHTSSDSNQAVAITDWVPWNGFEDLDATPDLVHYYWVRGASNAAGAHATGLSEAGSGFRSGDIFAPRGLVTTTTPGKIFLSWQPNLESTVARYRIYAGTRPEDLALIDSIQADEDPRTIIRDIVPLPDDFNVEDMGLNLSATENQIYDRFIEYFGFRPAVEWVDQLFAGQQLPKNELVSLEEGQTYYFKVAAVGENERVSMLSESTEAMALANVAGKVIATKGQAPAETGLAPNVPNPFNASTLIRFQLSTDGPTRLRLYNALGQVVHELVEGEYAAGHYAVSWDGRDLRGREVGSGMYFNVLETEDGIWRQRMLLLR